MKQVSVLHLLLYINRTRLFNQDLFAIDDIKACGKLLKCSVDSLRSSYELALCIVDTECALAVDFNGCNSR